MHNNKIEKQLLSEPRKFQFAEGWRWFVDAFHFFKRDTSAWTMIAFSSIAMLIVVMSLPFGSMIWSLASSIVMIGLYQGIQARESNEQVQMSHLFEGFSHPQIGQLFRLGMMKVALALLAAIVIGLIFKLGFNVEEFTELSKLAVKQDSSSEEKEAAALTLKEVLDKGITPQGLIKSFVILAIYVVMSLAFLFAPALVAFHKMKPLDAILLSLKGGLRNIVPLSVLFIIIIFCGFIATIPLLLGWLILLPMMILTAYRAYTEIFLVQHGGDNIIED